MKVNMYKWTMVALAGSAAALMGCESQSGGVEYQGTAPHGRPGATYDVKAAPKAASEAPAQKAAAKEETKAPAQAAKTTEAAAAPKAAR